MVDMKNFGPTPRTMKDACEKYWQTSAPAPDRSAMKDAGECVLWWIPAMAIGAIMGLLVGMGI